MFRALFALLFQPLLDEITYRSNVDKVDDEPLLAEEALVHAKSEHGNCYIIHFYIAARDTVVNCDMPYELWRDLEMKTRGTLTHQGGLFCSFESGGVLYCEEGYHVGN